MFHVETFTKMLKTRKKFVLKQEMPYPKDMAFHLKMNQKDYRVTFCKY